MPAGQAVTWPARGEGVEVSRFAVGGRGMTGKARKSRTHNHRPC
jgi:hypothetical protein